MTITENDPLVLADGLAEAATTFGGQGYMMFIQARENLLHSFVEERKLE